MSDWKPNLPVESSIRTESSKYNAGTKAKQQIHEERNTAENWKPIWEALESRGRDINDEPKQKDRPPCILVSSGPSLDDNIELFRKWRGGIICSTSHATTLMYYGIEPTYIVVLDPFCAWHEIAGVDWSKTKTKLIINPSVWPDLMANWPNEVLFFLQNVGRRDSFYATTQMHQFCQRIPDDARVREPQWKPRIRTELILFACTPPAEMFCADILGYGPCFLSGFDFACSPTLSRFTRWQPDTSGAWAVDRSPFVPSKDMILTDNGLASDQIMCYYKKNTISAWRLSKQQLYSMDQWTACTEIPKVDAAEVVERQGRGYEPLAEATIIERTEDYLAKIGAYIIVRPSGAVSFVESADPMNDLLRYMSEGRRIWACNKCGAEGKANDDNEHPTETCPVCGNAGMHRSAEVDVAANMVRIGALVAKYPPKPVNAVAPVGCAESRIDGSVLSGISVDTAAPKV